MKKQMEYAISSFEAGKNSSNQSCVEDLTNNANTMAILGYRLVSSVYDSRKKMTFMFFEREIKDEED